MSQVAISGNASGTGTLTIAAPNTNSNYTLTLPQATTTFVGTDATQTLTNKTIDGSQLVAASVTSTQLATLVIPIGVSQTWTDVTSSRALSTTYTNSTGKPIQVIVTTTNTSGTSDYNFLINGTSVFRLNNSYVALCSQAIVPSGATYSATSTGGGILKWFELR